MFVFSCADTAITGSPRDNIKIGLRAFPYRGRCFYLHIVDNKMFVIRVLHGKQDITARDFPLNIESLFCTKVGSMISDYWHFHWSQMKLITSQRPDPVSAENMI